MHTTTEQGEEPGSKGFDEARECARLSGRLMDGRMFWDLWFSFALLPLTFATREPGLPAVAGLTLCAPATSTDRAFKPSLDRAPVRRRGSRQGNVVYVDFR